MTEAELRAELQGESKEFTERVIGIWRGASSEVRPRVEVIISREGRAKIDAAHAKFLARIQNQ